MSARSLQRALARLTFPGALLLPERGDGRFALYPRGDRRRRPLLRLGEADVRALEAEGAIATTEDGGYAITDAGAARARREGAERDEQFTAQHRPIIDRAVVDAEGALQSVRGHESAPVLRRLRALRDAAGRPWLSASELDAASRVRADWERAQAGMARGSDWSSPPVGNAPRARNGAEAALAARCDAGKRVAEALHKLAPSLRRVVERVCFHEEGLEALERGEGWPARSGKLALKLALSQLAAAL